MIAQTPIFAGLTPTPMHSLGQFFFSFVLGGKKGKHITPEKKKSKRENIIVLATTTSMKLAHVYRYSSLFIQ